MPNHTDLPLVFRGLHVTDLLPPQSVSSNLTLNQLGDAAKAGIIERIISHRIMEDVTEYQICGHFKEAVGAGFDPNRIAKIALEQLGTEAQDNPGLTIQWLTRSLEANANFGEILASAQSELEGKNRNFVLAAINEWGAAHPTSQHG